MQGNWPYIVIVVCMILVLAFAWQEIRRANKKWLLLRILAVVVAMASLACIALPITYHTQRTSDANAIILITDGFDTDSLAGKNSGLFTFDETVIKAYPKAHLVAPSELDTTATLVIYGDGLTYAELQQIHNRRIIFYPGKLRAGVSNVSYNNKINAGEELQVQGIYNNTSAEKVKLVLKGLSTGLDSVIVPANKQTNFSLTAWPKTTGRLVYTLLADTAVEGSLPLQVNTLKPLKVLMLSASPDFESRFLKNWLADKGYAVAVRSAISKDKFNTSFTNIPQFNLDKLSLSTLKRFDVLIGDLSVLNSFSGAESAALKQQITDDGLGIIVKADSAGRASWLQASFPVDKSSGKEAAPSAITISGKKNRSGSLSTGQEHIVFRNGTQPVVTGTQGHILASSTMAGAGKVVFTTLGNTFSWTLAGNKDDYSALWSALIGKVARKNAEAVSDVNVSAIPFVNMPVQLSFNSNKQPAITLNKENAALAQYAATPFEWDATSWPATKGWQAAYQDKRLQWWYVHPNNEWRGVQASAKSAATKIYSDVHAKSDIVTKQIHQIVKIDVPKIYFYILLLAACTFLWIEAKFS